jgi:flagellar transcriptional activator FlhD
MKTEQILAEIHEANSSYLRLAKAMLQADREDARQQLGISEKVAVMLEQLSPDQLEKMSRTNTLLQRFEINDELVLGLLTAHGRRATPEAASAARGEDKTTTKA